MNLEIGCFHHNSLVQMLHFCWFYAELQQQPAPIFISNLRAFFFFLINPKRFHKSASCVKHRISGDLAQYPLDDTTRGRVILILLKFYRLSDWIHTFMFSFPCFSLLNHKKPSQREIFLWFFLMKTEAGTLVWQTVDGDLIVKKEKKWGI